MQHSELKKSENAWKRPEEVSKDLPEEEKETQVITCVTLPIAMYIHTYIAVHSMGYFRICIESFKLF